MAEWYPTSEADVEALPEAPAGTELFVPMLGPGQVLQVGSLDGKSITLAGRLDGAWVRVSVPTSQSAQQQPAEPK